MYSHKWHKGHASFFSTYGNRPIELIFQMPTASAKNCIATYTSFVCRIWPELLSVWKRSKAWFVLIRPTMGFLKAMKTIMMLKICSELPDMYIMMAVMGRPLTGPRATSQAFLTLSVSLSSAEGGFRG